jgi:hypothetical protein
MGERAWFADGEGAAPTAVERAFYLEQSYRILRRDLLPEAPAVESVVLTWSLPTSQRPSEPMACRITRDANLTVVVRLWWTDEIEVLQALAHQMIHLVLGFDLGHRVPFGRLAKRVALEGVPTMTIAGPAFRDVVARFRAELPPFPKGVILSGVRRRTQGTRLRLWECACEPPVKVRVSRDHLDATCNVCGRMFTMKGPPHCAAGGRKRGSTPGA